MHPPTLPSLLLLPSKWGTHLSLLHRGATTQAWPQHNPQPTPNAHRQRCPRVSWWAHPRETGEVGAILEGGRGGTSACKG